MQITIVIPTLNEEHQLRTTLQHLAAQCASPIDVHVIVVDAGSDDQTLPSVADLDLEIICDLQLRGLKYASLNRGLKASKSPVTLFLDADTLLPPRFDQRILETMEDDKIVGGAFDMTFEQMDWRLQICRAINRQRYKLEGLYYGDQAIFCRTKVARKLGGVPPKALMEAAYFCQELKKQGKLKLIKDTVITSSRRFKANGFWRVFFFDIRMWWRFSMGLDVTKFAADYWKEAQRL